MNEILYIPKTATLELTYKCNHRCVFCSCPWEYKVYEESLFADSTEIKKDSELSVEQWKEVIVNLERMGVKELAISGGEALLKDGLIELITYIRANTNLNKDRDIILISNALAMNENFLSIFKEYGIHLELSLPGLKTFQIHTGVDNAEGVLYWLGRAKGAGIKTTANITVTAVNYHELYETIANALIAGADDILLNRFLIGGRGHRYRHELVLSKEQLNGMLDIAEEVLTMANRYGYTGTEFPLCIIEKGVDHYKRIQISSICGAAKEFFVISPSGNIRVCNHSAREVGNILKSPAITDEEYWNRFVFRDYVPEECIKCEMTSFCDCGCREEANILSRFDNFGEGSSIDRLDRLLSDNNALYC